MLHVKMVRFFLAIFTLVVVNVNSRLWDFWRHIAKKFGIENQRESKWEDEVMMGLSIVS